MNRQDTIIAPATAIGEAGVAIIRISGEDSLFFFQSYFKSKKKITTVQTHYLYYGHITDFNDEVIDEVMAVYMEPKRSYTLEHVVEIHCHGSSQVVKKIISLALNINIRLAKPGEFTYRAFMNGRLDLTQAEAVSRLIHSRSEISRKTALYQLNGHMSRQISDYSRRIKDLVVYLEAWIDFPDEDIPDVEQLKDKVLLLIEDMSSLSKTYKIGQIVHEGATVVLIGLPNVGKSSLLNALLNQDRAIVSSVPGTTRDLIEEDLCLDGATLRLVDTAGLRESIDELENEGIRRTYERLKSADLVLVLHDARNPVDENVLNLLQLSSESSTALVLTKFDLVSAPPDTDFFNGAVCQISSHTGAGIEALKKTITELLYKTPHAESEPAYVTERRHYESLVLSVQYLSRFSSNYGLFTNDLLVADLRDALDILGQVTGRITTDSILEDIFSSFCIGK